MDNLNGEIEMIKKIQMWILEPKIEMNRPIKIVQCK